MTWTNDKVMALASDPAAAKAGQGQASPDKWILLANREQVLWGECRGSGKNPYQVQVEWNEPAFRCTCPSRKFPCKHSLGLMLLWVHQPRAFQSGPPPAWVTEWLDSREKKKQKSAEKAKAKQTEMQKPIDPEKTARQAEERKNKIRDGLQILMLRLHDLVAGGLSELPSLPYRFWDEAARRMVDAQAPGAARLIRELAVITAGGGAWAAGALERMARLKLMAEAFDRFDTLEPELQAELRSQLGWFLSKEEVLKGPGIVDFWVVLGVTVEEDEESGLQVQRIWLGSRDSGRPALLLHFAPQNQALDLSFNPGTGFKAELVYYPALVPLRALVRSRMTANEACPQPGGYGTIAEALQAFGAAAARVPWLERFPMLLEEVTPVPDAPWFLIDRRGQTIPLMEKKSLLWELAALSGGRPLRLFGEWREQCFFPIPALPLFRPQTAAALLPPHPLLKNLAHDAVLGTRGRNYQIPAVGGPMEEWFKRLAAEPEPAGALLKTAAVLTAGLRAGSLPAEPTRSVPEPCAAEVLPLCRAGAADLLGQILRNAGEKFLIEWLERARAARCLAPHHLLPDLLDQACRRPELQSSVRALAGQRGIWLAQWNPDWRAVYDPAALTEAEPWDPAEWEERDPKQRVIRLQALRSRNPAVMREILAEKIDQETAKERAALTALLKENLNPDDEPFLEARLEDRSLSVRQAAAELLSGLEGSGLNRRMQERLESWLRTEKKFLRTIFSLEPPENCDAAMQRDGIQES
ncbi:MAG: hypothetical protein EHM45_20670, partial [Desulfobacteraceae bacterium]